MHTYTYVLWTCVCERRQLPSSCPSPLMTATPVSSQLVSIPITTRHSDFSPRDSLALARAHLSKRVGRLGEIPSRLARTLPARETAAKPALLTAKASISSTRFRNYSQFTVLQNNGTLLYTTTTREGFLRVGSALLLEQQLQEGGVAGTS